MHWLTLVWLLAACSQSDPVAAPAPPIVPVMAQAPAPKPIAPASLSSAKLPGEAERLLPVLGAQITTFWPSLAVHTFPAGLVEQESNWRVRATLDKPREFGAGLGQFTRTFNADGSVRFDALADARALDPSLATWSWKAPYNELYQLRAVVLRLHSTDRACALAMAPGRDVLACDAAKYNGGAGSVSQRIRLCRVAVGCDPTRWDNNLDQQCPQSRTVVAGYGESFCQINSAYPGRVFARMKKYEGKI